jgi:mRNA-degrading endonuclease RelE of RelBE toxin-antitoxin system
LPYSIEISPLALEELKLIKAYYRQQIIDAIDEQLTHEPSVETRNRKRLDAEPDLPFERPVWQLRIGSYRVFYDLNEEERTVVVRSVREKPPHKTTRDIT